MTLSDDFDVFLNDKVRLNANRLERLQGHVESLDSFVAGAEQIGPIFLSTIPAGSWAHRTIIRPVDKNDEFDADLLVEVSHQDGWKASDYIEKLYSDLRSSGTYKDKVTRKTRCVTVNYAGDFHVDLVPFMDRWGRTYITNRNEPTSDGSFELSFPEDFNEWVDTKDRATNGYFRSSLQLLKYLRDFKSTFTCKSIILTTLAGKATNDIAAAADPERYSDLPTSFVSILEDLAESLPASMPAVLDPAGTGDNFTDRYASTWNYENFRLMIASYAERARTALEADDKDSEAAWRDIFGDSFKRDDDQNKVVSNSADSAAVAASWSFKVAAPVERFIDAEPLSFPIQLDPNHNVRVSGRCTGATIANRTFRNGFQQYDLSSRGNRVAKSRSVCFTATTSVPGPFRLFWKVRNSGAEAHDAGQLRGEIREDSGGQQLTETTSYRGTHYVEAYVVKDGVVCARDQQAVIVGMRN